jgi:hypothetical protein
MGQRDNRIRFSRFHDNDEYFAGFYAQNHPGMVNQNLL